MKKKDVPAFGPLQGIRVLSVGSAVAGPYVGSLMADFGATVLQVESSVGPDVSRVNSKGGIEQERRNELMINLNIPSAEGKEIIRKLLKETDIFVENGKGGQYAKWGLTDDVLWEANPKLIICHVSGFGQYGAPGYITRGAWDAIGQAFGGYTALNGEPDGLPTPAAPLTGDYMAGLHAAWACLAAYVNMLRTGEGESIDCAQFETVAKAQYGYCTDQWNFGVLRSPGGAKGPTGIAGWGPYRCKDGRFIYCCFNGIGAYRKGLKVIGLTYGGETFPEGTMTSFIGTPNGDLVEQAVIRFCSEHTAAEADRILSESGVPVSEIMDSSSMETNAHYKARNVVVEWENTSGQTIKGIKIVPELSKKPGRIWRGAARYGEDNDDILQELGYTEAEIRSLREKKVISNP